MNFLEKDGMIIFQDVPPHVIKHCRVRNSDLKEIEVNDVIKFYHDKIQSVLQSESVIDFGGMELELTKNLKNLRIFWNFLKILGVKEIKKIYDCIPVILDAKRFTFPKFQLYCMKPKINDVLTRANCFIENQICQELLNLQQIKNVELLQLIEKYSKSEEKNWFQKIWNLFIYLDIPFKYIIENISHTFLVPLLDEDYAPLSDFKNILRWNDEKIKIIFQNIGFKKVFFQKSDEENTSEILKSQDVLNKMSDSEKEEILIYLSKKKRYVHNLPLFEMSNGSWIAIDDLSKKYLVHEETGIQIYHIENQVLLKMKKKLSDVYSSLGITILTTEKHTKQLIDNLPNLSAEDLLETCQYLVKNQKNIPKIQRVLNPSFVWKTNIKVF